jgi:hypothetical protein
MLPKFHWRSKEPVAKKLKAKKEPAIKKLKAKESKEPAACSKPGGQRRMTSFFKPKQQQQEDKAVASTFPWDQLAPSPPAKAKSPSAVMGAGFIPEFSLSL